MVVSKQRCFLPKVKKTIFILHSYFSFVICYEVQQLFSVYDRMNNEKQEQTNVIASFLHLHFKFKENKAIASSCKFCENSLQYFCIMRCSFCTNVLSTMYNISIISLENIYMETYILDFNSNNFSKIRAKHMKIYN